MKLRYEVLLIKQKSDILLDSLSYIYIYMGKRYKTLCRKNDLNLWSMYEATSTLSVVCDTLAEHKVIKFKITSGMQEIVI